MIFVREVEELKHFGRSLYAFSANEVPSVQVHRVIASQAGRHNTYEYQNQESSVRLDVQNYMLGTKVVSHADWSSALINRYNNGATGNLLRYASQLHTAKKNVFREWPKTTISRRLKLCEKILQARRNSVFIQDLRLV